MSSGRETEVLDVIVDLFSPIDMFEGRNEEWLAARFLGYREAPSGNLLVVAERDDAVTITLLTAAGCVTLESLSFAAPDGEFSEAMAAALTAVVNAWCVA